MKNKIKHIRPNRCHLKVSTTLEHVKQMLNTVPYYHCRSRYATGYNKLHLIGLLVCIYFDIQNSNKRLNCTVTSFLVLI